MVSRVLSLELGTDETRRVLEGCVGPGPATEFDLFRTSLRTLPDLERIAKGENVVPSDPSTGFAVVTGLVARFGAGTSHLPRLIAYARHLGKNGLRELEVLLVRDLLRRNPATARLPAFQEWAKENVQALA